MADNVTGAEVWLIAALAGLFLLAVVTMVVLQARFRARTARLEADNARFKDSLAHLRQFVASTDDVVFTLDREQRHTSIYGRWLERSGQRPEGYLGRSAADLFGAEAARAHEEANLQALEGRSVVYEWSIPQGDATRYYQTSLAPLVDADGTVTGIVGIGRDITQLKRVETALRESEARYRSLFQNNHATMLLIDPDGGQIVDANPAAERYYGWSRDALCGMLISDINVLSKAEVQAEMDLARAEKRNHFIFRHRRADGEIRDVEVYSGPIRLGDRALLYSIIHDITDRRRVERDLLAWQDLLQAIIKHAPSSICVLDRELRYVYVSDRFIEDYRLPDRDLIGKRHYDVFPDIPERWREVHRRVLEGETIGEKEDSFLRADGTVDWVRWECRPWHLAGGEVAGIVLSTEVIAERKQAEMALRTLNARLEQRVAERTAELEAANQELEAFAYSVSHDLRAPLRAMDSFSAALVAQHSENLDGVAQHYLERIRMASQRMATLIQDLLDLSRVTRQEMVRERVDLSALAGEMVSDLRGRDPDRAAEITIADGLTVEGDRHLWRIALQNLLENAWKFTATNPNARIELGAMRPDGVRPDGVRPGGTVFYVRDNGVGFDMAYAGKLFNPFQRLHATDAFPGTGIGLVTVRRIVTRHGGRVWAEAEEGRGATFYFTAGGEA